MVELNYSCSFHLNISWGMRGQWSSFSTFLKDDLSWRWGFFILSWPYKGFLIVLCWASSKLIYCRYSSSSSNFQSSQRYSSSSSSYKISNIREESEDYTFQENRRKHSGYSKYADDGGLSNGMNGMSLDGLRKPNIDSWDSMGILGLSSKMWNDTSSKKQGYMSSMREESYNSYIMWKIMHLSCIQLTTFLQKITKEEKIKNQTKNVKEKLLLIKVKKETLKKIKHCVWKLTQNISFEFFAA